MLDTILRRCPNIQRLAIHLPDVLGNETGRPKTLWNINLWKTTIKTLRNLARHKESLPHLEELHFIPHGHYQSDVPKPEELGESIKPFFARDSFHVCFDLSNVIEAPHRVPPWKRTPAYCRFTLPNGHPMAKRIYMVLDSHRHVRNDYRPRKICTPGCSGVLYTREGVTRYSCPVWVMQSWWALDGPNVWRKLNERDA